MQTLHVVSHTHWDREWYRTFQQFRLKLVHLVDNVLEILDADPSYKYFMLDGQTIVLEDYLLMRPENEKRLRDYIKSGRILIGPWYILPDEFLVSPESTIRNLLIGKEICQNYSKRMMIGYLPDPFGHISQMPGILRGFGIDKACLWRGVPYGSPTLLEWEGADGSKVLLAHLYFGYGDIADWPGSDNGQNKEALDARADRLEPYQVTDQFLLMRGTDHYEPRPNTPEAIRYYNSKQSKREAVHSTLPAYFEAVKNELKEKKTVLRSIHGELRSPRKAHLLPGVDSARMWIKQRNWFSQTLLERWVEPFSTWAEMVERELNAFDAIKGCVKSPRIPNPAPIVHQAWKLLITNHPHDSICGCSIDETHADMGTRFDQVDQIGEEITQQSLKALTESINTKPSEVNKSAYAAVTVFNAAPVAQTQTVEVSIDLPLAFKSVTILDEHGEHVPASVWVEEPQIKESNTIMISDLQGLLTSASSEGRNNEQMVAANYTQDEGLACIEATFSALVAPDQDNLMMAFTQIMGLISSSKPSDPLRVKSISLPTAHVSFVAADLPAVGYKTYWVAGEKALQEGPEAFSESETIENDWFSINLEDAWNGSFSLTDKRTNHTYRGLNQFVDLGDRGDEYNFCPPENDTACEPEIYSAEAVHTLLDDTIYLECKYELPVGLSESRDSRSETTEDCALSIAIRLPKAQPVVDVQVQFDNHVLDHRLEVRFPTDIKVDTARYDAHFDVVERPIDLPEHDKTWREQPRPEVPQQAFADVSQKTRGFMLANQGLPEVATLRDEKGRAVLALTLLRCVGWLSRDDIWVRQGNAGPGLETPDAQEQGVYEFSYRLIPHQGDWLKASDLAYSFQTQPRAEVSSLHDGKLGPSSALFHANNPAFHLTSIKTAENGSGFVMRGFNMLEKDIELTLATPVPFAEAEEIRLDEEKIKTLKTEDFHGVALKLAPKAISSILFRKAKA